MTRRLVLDDLTPADANDLFEARGDPEVMAFWDWPHDASASVTATVVEQLLRDVAAGDACYWTLRQRSDGSFVGLCDLSQMQADRADLGYMLVRRFWGMGLAQEAIACVLEQARARGLKLVSARIHRDNERSTRLLERAGFTEVESIRDIEIRPGVYRECKEFELRL